MDNFNDITKIEIGAFGENNQLQEIFIAQSVQEIDVSALSECVKLERIIVDDNNTSYRSKDGRLYDYEMKTLLYSPRNHQDENVIIPNGVEEIGNGAFSESRLKRVIIPNSVVKIDDYAFSFCKSLYEITLSDSLKSIGKCAFLNTYLLDITIPNGVEVIGEEAFANTKLGKVTIPSSVLEIGKCAFAGCKRIEIYDTIFPDAQNCYEAIDTKNGKSETPIGYLGRGTKYYSGEDRDQLIVNDCEIVVKSSKSNEILYAVWMGSEFWQRKYYCLLASAWGKNGTFAFKELDAFFSKIDSDRDKFIVANYRLKYPIDLDETYKSKYEKYLNKLKLKEFDIVNGKLNEYNGVDSEILIPDGVEQIAKGAFHGKPYIEKITVSKSLKLSSIQGVFNSEVNVSLDEFFSEGGVIKTEAKREYRGTIDIPSENKNIRIINGVLYTINNDKPTCAIQLVDKKLERIVFEEGTTRIHSDFSAFNPVVTEVIIPESVKTIGNGSFEQCEELKNVTIKGRSIIGVKCFYKCPRLSDVIMISGAESIGGNAFVDCPELTIDDQIIVGNCYCKIYKQEKDVVIPDGVELVAPFALEKTSPLLSLELPNSVRQISQKSFMAEQAFSSDLIDSKAKQFVAQRESIRPQKMNMPENFFANVGYISFLDAMELLDSVWKEEKNIKNVSKVYFSAHDKSEKNWCYEVLMQDPSLSVENMLEHISESCEEARCIAIAEFMTSSGSVFSEDLINRVIAFFKREKVRKAINMLKKNGMCSDKA